MGTPVAGQDCDRHRRQQRHRPRHCRDVRRRGRKDRAGGAAQGAARRSRGRHQGARRRGAAGRGRSHARRCRHRPVRHSGENLSPPRRAGEQCRHRHPPQHRRHHARLLARGARHQHHRGVSVRARGDPHDEGADAEGRPHHQHRQRFGEDAAAGFAALHRDQIRPARHDPPAHHGRPQAQHRRLDPPSRRDAVVVHHAAAAAPRPAPATRRRIT